MSRLEQKHKQIVVDMKNYDELKMRGHLRMTFNDVITELLRNQKKIETEGTIKA